MEKDIILEVNDLSVEFKTEDGCVKAVNHLSFQVERKKTLGLVGETGAGKTTTALSILNLIPHPPGNITSGTIHFNGKNVLEMSEKDLEKMRGSDIAMIFQDPMTALNPVMTVGEQIGQAYEIHENLNKKEAFEKAKSMLKLVGIPETRAYDYPHQFSGGMRQRVIIAIALACNPHLLLADEPTTALDVTIQAQVLELIKQLIRDRDMSMVLITHDLGVVAEVCDDVAVMYAGRIVEIGSAYEIFNDTKHPYTEGLFNSLPNLKKRGEDLEPIHGMVPDPANLPKGCTFAPRCPYATEKCHVKEPSAYHIGDSHYVFCHRYEEKDFKLNGGKHV